MDEILLENSVFFENEKIKKQNIFIKNIYYYYVKDGFYNILIEKFLEIISLIFVIIFMIFVFILLDWENIIICGKTLHEYCKDINSYITISRINNPELFTFFIIIFIFGLVLISSYKIYKFPFIFKEFYEVDKYYVNSLKIKRHELYTKDWNDIINILKLNKNEIPMDLISNIIVRNENYFTALCVNNIFKIPPNLFTKQLEFTLYYGLDPFIYTNKTVLSIEKRLKILGIINLVLSPFILFYIILSFVFYNIDEIYLNKKMLGPRRYSQFFKWEVREYNELSHYFNIRINNSIKYSNLYLSQFPSLRTEIIAKFFGLISGAFIVLFLILSILDENILLFVTYLDRSLIFYAGIFASISAFSRGLIREPENTLHNPEDIMEKIYKYTHYMPEKWKNKCNTYEVRDEFTNKFKYIIVLFLYDIIGVITTPYLLLFVISKEADNISSFFIHNTYYIRNIGQICKLSDFKNTEINKKMSSSIASYSENHPSWNK